MRFGLLVLATSAASIAVSPAVVAAQAAPPAASAQRPPARPDDVKSVDAIITALYASISGKLGEKRDWDRMRSLFTPDARMVPLVMPPGQPLQARSLTVDDYVTRSGPMIEQQGFAEREIHRVVEEFGPFVNVWSTYSGGFATPNAPVMRGINSIQLMNDGTRWWVVAISWLAETPTNPLPAKYLPKGG
jgi:hypothetical protein